MKQVSEFHLLESEHRRFVDPHIGESFFEQQKIAYGFEESENKDYEQESMMKSPKKKGRKLSMKNNPEDNNEMKVSKMREKKYKVVTGDKEKNPNQLFGHWSPEENKRYHWFLEIYHSHFMNRSLRRMDRIFTSMAKFVGTREAQQCRSHHQKMQKKHKTFPKILLSLRMNYHGTYTQGQLKVDIESNDIPLIEPLLTEQFLLKNLTQKETLHLDNHQKSQARSENENEDDEEKPSLILPPHGTSVDMIEQVLVPQFESSKNYFKFLPQNQDDRNNILDDGYERNLPFQGFFQ